MQSGGPIAFYEIAATLIPVLFLGGVVLDNMHPPDPRKLKKELDKSEGEHREYGRFFLFVIAVYYLPAAGVLVIVAEATALDVVVSKEADTAHALIVCIALLTGMVAVAAAVWVPWVLKFGDFVKEQLHMSPRSVVGSAALVSVAGAISLAVLHPWGINPFPTLVSAVEKAPQREPKEDRHYSSEVTWLEHLIATSSYRIDRLEEEREHISSKAVRLRIKQHLLLQKETQRRQYVALEKFK